MPGDDNNKKKVAPISTHLDIGPYPKVKSVYTEGNPDAQILAKAYEEFAKDGLTPAERSKIEKMDEILKDAAIVITPSGDKATVVQGDGKTFTLNAKPTGRSR